MKTGLRGKHSHVIHIWAHVTLTWFIAKVDNFSQNWHKETSDTECGGSFYHARLVGPFTYNWWAPYHTGMVIKRLLYELQCFGKELTLSQPFKWATNWCQDIEDYVQNVSLNSCLLCSCDKDSGCLINATDCWKAKRKNLSNSPSHRCQEGRGAITCIKTAEE